MCGHQTRNRGTKGIPRCQSLKSILRFEIQQTRQHLNKVTMCYLLAIAGLAANTTGTSSYELFAEAVFSRTLFFSYAARAAKTFPRFPFWRWCFRDSDR